MTPGRWFRSHDPAVVILPLGFDPATVLSGGVVFFQFLLKNGRPEVRIYGRCNLAKTLGIAAVLALDNDW